MNRNTVVVFATAIVFAGASIGRAMADSWGVTDTVSVAAITGTPFMEPPGIDAPVPLSSTHTCEVENTGTGNQSGNVSMSLRLYVEQGSVTYGSPGFNGINTLWAPGDMLYINNLGTLYHSGSTGGQLTTNISDTKSFGASTYTAHAFTHILLNGTAYNVDDNSKTFQVIW